MKNFLKDIGAGLRNIFGGRSGSYEQELLNARTSALRELESRARERGADAVVNRFRNSSKPWVVENRNLSNKTIYLTKAVLIDSELSG